MLVCWEPVRFGRTDQGQAGRVVYNTQRQVRVAKLLKARSEQISTLLQENSEQRGRLATMNMNSLNSEPSVQDTPCTGGDVTTISNPHSPEWSTSIDG
jgi:hypothetical protein